jgi:hypothetical protein
MAKNAHKSRIFLDRHAAIESLGVGSGVRQELPSVRRPPTIFFTGSILFALLAILPLAWGVSPLPFSLGEVARHDIVARVAFAWRDKKEQDRQLEEIDQRLPRRYRETSKWDWTLQLWGPLTDFLEKAAQAKDVREVQEFADVHGLALPSASAQTLLDALAGKHTRVYSDITVPAQGILREVIFRRGVLDRERFKEERKRQIRVLDKNSEERLLYVEPGSRASPIEVPAVGAVLGDHLGEYFEKAGLDLRLLSELQAILQKRIAPSLLFDREATAAELEREKARVLSETSQVSAGEILVPRDEQIATIDLLLKLQAEKQAYQQSLRPGAMAAQILCKALFVFFLALGFTLYARRRRGMRRLTLREMAGVAGLALIHLVFLYALILLGLDRKSVV